MIFSASADLLNSRGMIIPRALHKSADAEKITIKLLVTDIYISNFSQLATFQYFVHYNGSNLEIGCTKWHGWGVIGKVLVSGWRPDRSIWSTYIMGQLAAVPVEQQLLEPPGPNHLSTIGLQNINKGCVAILEKKVPIFFYFLLTFLSQQEQTGMDRKEK